MKMDMLRRFRNEKGASAVEYSFMVAAIAALIILIAFALGRGVFGAFDHTCSSVNTNIDPSITQCT